MPINIILSNNKITKIMTQEEFNKLANLQKRNYRLRKTFNPLTIKQSALFKI